VETLARCGHGGKAWHGVKRWRGVHDQRDHVEGQ
jgi:hypothetical protein